MSWDPITGSISTIHLRPAHLYTDTCFGRWVQPLITSWQHGSQTMKYSRAKGDAYPLNMSMITAHRKREAVCLLVRCAAVFAIGALIIHVCSTRPLLSRVKAKGIFQMTLVAVYYAVMIVGHVIYLINEYITHKHILRARVLFAFFHNKYTGEVRSQTASTSRVTSA